jgi:hypothetical protein
LKCPAWISFHDRDTAPTTAVPLAQARRTYVITWPGGGTSTRTG